MIRSTNISFLVLLLSTMDATLLGAPGSSFTLGSTTHHAIQVIKEHVTVTKFRFFAPHKDNDNNNNNIDIRKLQSNEAQEYHQAKVETSSNNNNGVLKKNNGIVTTDPWSADNFLECANLWNLNDEEKKKMRVLQTRLMDIEHWKNDPFEVVRFLMEFDGDVDVAEEKFRQMIAWRIENNIDNFLENYEPPALFNYIPIATLKGADRDGDPIHVERTGAGDLLGIVRRYGEEEMIKHAIWVREQDTNGEWRREHERVQGKRIKQFTVVMDLQGFSRKHIHPSLMPVGKKVSRFIQDNYPGFAKKIIIIRAPPIFRMAWSMFKPFVDKNTRDLIVFSNSNDAEEALKEHLDPKVMPPVICPSGKGEAALGFNPIWEGGPLPNEEEELSLHQVKFPHQQHEEDLIHQIPVGIMTPA